MPSRYSIKSLKCPWNSLLKGDCLLRQKVQRWNGSTVTKRLMAGQILYLFMSSSICIHLFTTHSHSECLGLSWTSRIIFEWWAFLAFHTSLRSSVTPTKLPGPLTVRGPEWAHLSVQPRLWSHFKPEADCGGLTQPHFAFEVPFSGSDGREGELMLCVSFHKVYFNSSLKISDHNLLS